MKGLPAWMLAVLAALSVALIWLGNHELHEIGPGPLIIGILWGIFTLASIAANLRSAIAPDTE